MLEDHGVCHFEEPCPYWEIEWTKQVTEALDLDVTGGEQDCDLDHLAAHRRPARPSTSSSPTSATWAASRAPFEVAKMAAAAGLPCVPHSANLSLVTVFSLHLMGAIANAGPYVEFSIEPSADYYPWQDGIFTPELKASDGRVPIPDGPGWGVEINPDWLAAAEYRVSELD